MRSVRTIRFAFALGILFASSAFAAPVVYEGTLVNGVSATGSVPTGNGWINNRGAEVDYWAFAALAGNMATIRVHPLDVRFDPAFSIYIGTTSADTSGFSNFSDWGGLTFVDFGATTSGAGTDAEWTINVTDRSLFTIAVGGWESTAQTGPFAYQITVTGIPEPVTIGLMCVALAGLGFTRRRIKKA